MDPRAWRRDQDRAARVRLSPGCACKSATTNPTQPSLENQPLLEQPTYPKTWAGTSDPPHTPGSTTGDAVTKSDPLSSRCNLHIIHITSRIVFTQLPPTRSARIQKRWTLLKTHHTGAIALLHPMSNPPDTSCV